MANSQLYDINIFMEKNIDRLRPRSFETLVRALQPDLELLYNHKIYSLLDNQSAIQKFMELHGVAVWDFMNVLSVLRQQVVCTSVPWEPPKYPVVARFVNEIFTVEESDQVDGMQSISHYELYLKAMQEVGADSSKVTSFVELMCSDEGATIEQMEKYPRTLIEFVQFGFDLIDYEIWEVTAAFLFGREKIIPEMFQKFLDTLSASTDDSEFKFFKLYLKRHIEVDGNDHGPMAEKMLKAVCEKDEQKWFYAYQMAKQAIHMRIKFWSLCEKTIL